MTSTHSREDDTLLRRRWVGVLARADAAMVQRLARSWGPAPAYDLLRGPEVGLVMVRARAGGTGAPFNLGEMTATRCSVRLTDGTLGHACIGGRDTAHCETAAWLDALLQDDAHRERLMAAVIAPLEQAAAERRALAAGKAAATRVEFFTLATEAN